MPGRAAARRQPVAVLTLLALLLCLFSLIELWRLGEESPAIDFYRAWAMAQSPSRYATPAGLEDPYAEAAQERLAETMRQRVDLAGRPPRLAAAVQASEPMQLTATPFLYSVFGLISNQTYERDHRLYRSACLVSTVLAIALLGWLWGYSPAGVLLWLALLGQFFQPLQSDLRVGNVNQLQLAHLAAFLALSAWADQRRARDTDQRSTDLVRATAGMTIAFAIAFKPNVAFVVPLVVLLRSGRGRARDLLSLLAGLGAGSAMAWVVGCLYFRSWSIWHDWVLALRRTPDAAIPAGYGNFAPSRWIADRYELEVGPLLAVACALPIVGMLWHKRRQLRASRTADAYAVGLGLLWILAVAPLTWQHYLLLTVPLFLLLLGPANPERGPRLLAVAALTLLAIDPFAELFSVKDPIHQAPPVHLGLLLLLCASLWAVATVSRAISPQPQGSIPEEAAQEETVPDRS